MKWGEFLYKFCLNTFRFFLRTERDTIKMYTGLHVKYRYSCQILLRP